MKVGFIVEANFNIGMGHVSRCVDIYREFSKRGVDSELIVPNNLELIKFLNCRNIRFSTINIESWSAIGNEDLVQFTFLKGYDILFLDLIEEAFENLNFLSGFYNVLLVSITLLFFSNKKRYEDISFFPDVERKVEGFISGERKKVKLFSGKEFFTFRDEFNSRIYSINKNTPYRLLITMGGSDPNNITGVVYGLLRNLTMDFECTIILGDANAHAETDFVDSRFRIVKSVQNISDFMLDSDLVFITGGLTRYELAVLGVPFVTVSINDVQYDINQRFFKLVDESLNIGKYDELNAEKFNALISSILKDHNRRRLISKKMKFLFDTDGATRIADIVISEYYKKTNR